jgi:hypothetical protein
MLAFTIQVRNALFFHTFFPSSQNGAHPNLNAGIRLFSPLPLHLFPFAFLKKKRRFLHHVLIIRSAFPVIP